MPIPSLLNGSKVRWCPLYPLYHLKGWNWSTISLQALNVWRKTGSLINLIISESYFAISLRSCLLKGTSSLQNVAYGLQNMDLTNIAMTGTQIIENLCNSIWWWRELSASILSVRHGYIIELLFDERKTVSVLLNLDPAISALPSRPGMPSVSRETCFISSLKWLGSHSNCNEMVSIKQVGGAGTELQHYCSSVSEETGYCNSSWSLLNWPDTLYFSWN